MHKDMDHYDAIIIGAGISGLTAAIYLVRGGARVLLCEQSERVGGLFNSFWHVGYLFDGGIKAVLNSGIVIPMLRDLGLLDRVRLVRSHAAMILRSEVQPILGLDDVRSYFGTLSDLFPEEDLGLRRVLSDILLISGLLQGLTHLAGSAFGTDQSVDREAGSLKGVLGALGRSPPLLARAASPLRTYLSKRISDPCLLNLLAGPYPDGTSTLFGLAYWSMFLDYYYPEGGVGALTQVLADSFEADGGRLLLGARVERVQLSARRASGVLLADGQEFRAGYVVATGDARQTFTRLVPSAAFEKGLPDAETSHSVFQVFLGLDIPPEELGLHGCGHVFYHPDMAGIDDADRLQRED